VRPGGSSVPNCTAGLPNDDGQSSLNGALIPDGLDASPPLLITIDDPFKKSRSQKHPTLAAGMADPSEVIFAASYPRGLHVQRCS
jgi:hypothetical protein